MQNQISKIKNRLKLVGKIVLKYRYFKKSVNITNENKVQITKKCHFNEYLGC